MNRILAQIRQTMADAASEFLGEDYPGSVEDQGAVFYMNGKNGTEFDWFVNDRLPSFMMFYDDEENLGAVKAMVYKDGTLFLYVYEDRGRSLKQEFSGKTGFEEKELLSLAVLLRTAADDRRIWDADIEKIPLDVKTSFPTKSITGRCGSGRCSCPGGPMFRRRSPRRAGRQDISAGTSP